MSTYLTIKALHDEGVAKKTIARRLGLDPRTVRKHIRRIEEGQREPRRVPVARKMDRYDERIREAAARGLSVVQVGVAGILIGVFLVTLAR